MLLRGDGPRQPRGCLCCRDPRGPRLGLLLGAGALLGEPGRRNVAMKRPDHGSHRSCPAPAHLPVPA